MLLYDAGDPKEALNMLGKYVIGVHCKDGKRPTKKGKLGKEYPLGEVDKGYSKGKGTLGEIKIAPRE